MHKDNKNFKMKTNLKTKINGNEISVIVYPDGKCAPISNEVLKIAGLGLLIPELKKFYDLLGNIESKTLLKWVAYEADMTYEQARIRIKKYLLIDGGCRMCFGQTEEIRIDEFRMLQSDLSMLGNDHIYSYPKLAEMLNKEGFEINIKSSTTIYFDKPSELYEWTLNNMGNMSLELQEKILKDLKYLNWIPTMIRGLDPFQIEVFKSTLLNMLEDKSKSFCLMSISCVVYNLKLHGEDVTELEEAINTSECVVEEIEKMFN
jgi:hypothetical protein